MRGVGGGMAAWFLVCPAASAQEPRAVEVHGFVSQGALKSTDNNFLAKSERGSLEFTEIGLNVTQQVSDDLRVGAQLFARDLGPVGNYRPQFDWAYLDYRFSDWLGIRAGRTKLPFGLYNETSDIDVARVPILLPQSTYPTENRDFLLAQTGFELYGYGPLGDVSALEYRLYGGTIFLDTTNADDTLVSLDVPYIIGGRLMWMTPLSGLQIGGSAQALRLDFEQQLDAQTLAALQMAGQVPMGFDGRISAKIPAVLWVGSIEYQVSDLLVAAEYGRWHVSLESSEPDVTPESETVQERAYVMGSYRVTPKLSPGLYYSLQFPDVDDRKGRDAYRHDVAATLRYDITDNWIAKLEGHYLVGTAGLDDELNDGAERDELKKHWGLFLLKTTAFF